MRAKPEMKPWVNTDTKNKSSVGAALSARAFVLCRCGLWLCIRWESAAPLGLNKSISMLNPGLAPWAMQEYRPCRAPCGLVYSFTWLFCAKERYSP